MPEDSSLGAEASISKAEEQSPPSDASTAPAVKPNRKLPGFVVAAAGLAVFDAIIAVGYVVVWLADTRTGMAIIQTLAGVSILLGLGAIVVGSLILNSNRRTGNTMPGSPWARVSIVSGLLLLGVTVILPLISALAVLIGSTPN